MAQLLLTSVHHVYGALVYATPWRFHVLLLTVPAMFAIVAANRRLQQPEPTARVRWLLVLVTLAVPVLAIGAFEGLYNHVLKDLLFFLGASPDLMARMFPRPPYEMPNDAFFEVTGVTQAVLGAATAGYLARFLGSSGAAASRRGPSLVHPRTLESIDGSPVSVPDRANLVHLQFRRFAGCPVCSLHLRTFARRHDEIRRAHVREVVVFHSSAAELRRYADGLPFAVVADAGKQLYREFGLDASPRALLDPRAWGAILRGVARSLIASLRRVEALPPIRPDGGRFGLPADFLIASDGRVLASKYGVHADDQWSVEELLALAREAADESRA